MTTLATVIRDQWHAVERDLLQLGKTADDIGVSLDTAQLISIVLAAPPGTSCHMFNPQAWTKTDELLANMAEQDAGLLSLTSRYARPGVGEGEKFKPPSAFEALPAYRGVVLDSLPADEFTVRLKQRQAEARASATSDRQVPEVPR